jgi:hypothetical protein
MRRTSAISLPPVTRSGVSAKSDDTGWDVYEESRRGGAVIATAHEHSYARTHPLRNCQDRVVDEFGAWFTIARDDPDTPADEGVSFVFHNGLAGRSIREQERCLPPVVPYGCSGEWAAIYAEQQGANYGALFGVFNVDSNPRLAFFYFVDIDGTLVDQFVVEATWGPCCWHDLDGDCGVSITDVLKLIARWGTDPGGPPDFDGDGVVGVMDFLRLVAHWGPCA